MLTITGAIYEAPAIVALGPTWSAVAAGFAVVWFGEVYLTSAGEMYLQSIGATNDDAILNSWRCGRTGRALRTYPAGMHPPTLTRIVSYIAGLRARRCAASARRSGASLGEPQPSWLCQMENPTKASTATLRTIIAIAATSMMESRLAMRHFWRQSSDRVDLDHGLLMRRGPSSRHHRDTVPAIYDDGGSFS
jgi:hypothetical protein